MAEAAPPLTAPARLQAALQHYQAGQFAQAEGYCRQLLSIDPLHADSVRLLGIVLREQGRFEEAAACCRQAVAAHPHDEALLLLLAAVLEAQQRWAEAAELYQRALALNPAQAAAHYALGLAYMRLDQPASALAPLQAALRLQPDAETAVNLGAMHLRLGQLHDAVDCCRAALRLQPDCAEAHNNLGIALLALGEMPEGWAEFEWRWQVEPGLHGQRDFEQPQWTGEFARGCTLLIHHEQGFGDTLQFCRYAALARTRGLNVVLEAPAALVRLLRRLSGVSAVIAQGEPLPHFDLHCPMLSLPLALGTTVATIPGTTPYLFADAAAVARWRTRVLGAGDGLRVGLVWAGGRRADGSQAAAVDKRRSLALERIMPLLEVPGMQFFSLQKGGVVPGKLPLTDWTNELQDFADTAALVTTLDLVISVDTSVAHLAGALGKPVWLLDRFDHCWRWLAGRLDSPWYPSLRIFRQPQPGDWDAVLRAALIALRALTGHHGR